MPGNEARRLIPSRPADNGSPLGGVNVLPYREEAGRAGLALETAPVEIQETFPRHPRRRVEPSPNGEAPELTTVDRSVLKAWYRDAMKDRIRELEDLRTGLSERRKAAGAEARQIGHALLGSGASFGFPEVSEAGRLVEMAPASDMARRVEGLLAVLTRVAYPDASELRSRFAWLAASVDVDQD